MNVVALVPAYQPASVLLDTVQALVYEGFPSIVVVDDGSTLEESAQVFSLLRDLSRVTVLTHPVNRGKGAALHTGLRYIHETFGGQVGAVTLDADGQHDVRDVVRVAEELERFPDHVILGSRTFVESCVPWPRRIGAVLIRAFVRLMVGRDILDAQTGLRGIPMPLIPELLKIAFTGYEWETEMLFVTRHYPLRQVPIESIYIGKNESSHFRPFQDTWKMYSLLLRSRLRDLLRLRVRP